MKQSKEEAIRSLSFFVATMQLKKILDAMKIIREFSKINNYEVMPKCMLLTGEAGVGKTYFIKQYVDSYPRYDISDDFGEKTIVPVLYCELPKAKHPKPVVSQLLYKLGDPLKGLKGDVRELTERLIHLLKETKTELIIVDEVQHAIETTNRNVIQEIGEWFKILINESRIPIVLVGVPWAQPVIDVNAQLRRRVRYHYELKNYTLKTFDEFQMFLQKIEERLPVKIYTTLWEVEMAFRLFAASNGNLSELLEGTIIPACEIAITNSQEVVTEENFIEAIDENSNFKYKNPFLIDSIKDIRAYQQKTSSRWNASAKNKQQRVIDAVYAKVKFSDLKLNDILSKKK
ncbi:TniB family NTP-binding protein [Shewanella sp. 202IG2-18]|uniref:TniB family NTP-binding protein n=1 Tax=Parashewanella hymeniacidonis TaxID=2807618 RepID=UPI001961C1DB|nr:TniB family NTP-binding protein [Parashewanella hymeniacidonis]MBM7070679.1 TniB family NTP-binding protein [Parashewanella hymeniacidonis]